MLSHVVEIREELIELLLRERIELVVVASRARDRQAHEHRGGRVHAIDDVFDRVLFGNDAAFRVAAVITIEPGGDLLVQRSVGQQVAGQLLDRELVVGHVAIERVDHPVAPPPHEPLAVGLIAVAVGIARSIEPGERHALAILRRAQQPIDDLLVCVRRRVLQKRVELRWRRRQTDQVE